MRSKIITCGVVRLVSRKYEKIIKKNFPNTLENW